MCSISFISIFLNLFALSSFLGDSAIHKYHLSLWLYIVDDILSICMRKFVHFNILFIYTAKLLM